MGTKVILSCAAKVLAAVFFTACSLDAGVPVEGNLVPLQLSLSLQSAPETRSVVEVTQSNQLFRGIQDIVLLPFSKEGVVSAGDRVLGPCDNLENIIDLRAGNNSCLYERKWVPRGTASFLFFGKARPYSGRKSVEGSLLSSGFTEGTAGEIAFSPDPILSEEPSSEKIQVILDWLNRVAQSVYGSYYWSSLNSNNYYYGELANIFSSFTNGGNIMAGSSESLRRMVSIIYDRVEAVPNRNTTVRYLKAVILNNILSNGVTRYNGTLSLPGTMSGYPGDGLPEGAAAIRWNGSRFVAGEDTGALLSRLDRFCYPMSLWYYVNSRINTTTNDSNTYLYLNDNVYGGSTYDTWSKVLGVYEHSPGVVEPETLGAALVDPVKYGVGMLEVTLKKSQGNWLVDRSGTYVSVGGTMFPLNGIIVGEQRVQGFNFSPIGEEDYSLYDTEFSGQSYLSSTAAENPIQTLVLESVEDAVIHFALEFINNSSSSFAGATGNILPGSNFYLFGNLRLDDLPDEQRIRDGELVRKVFEKDRKVSVSVWVTSLRDAYNNVPDMRDPQLQLGVVADIDWLMPEPAEIPLF